VKKSICGEADCPTPYEFCEACIRADERQTITSARFLEGVSATVRADLRTQMLALPVIWAGSPLLDPVATVDRADVLALLDGATDD
jgi:hypothetical protein